MEKRQNSRKIGLNRVKTSPILGENGENVLGAQVSFGPLNLIVFQFQLPKYVAIRPNFDHFDLLTLILVGYLSSR